MGAIRSKFLPHAPQSLAAAALGRWAASPAPDSRWRMHVLSRLIVTTMSVALSAGCSSKMSVSTVGGIKNAATAAFKVTALSKIVTAPGEVLTLTGSGFRSTLSLAQISGLNLNDANGQSVTAQLAVQSGDKATVTLPASMSFGKYALTLTQDGESQQITLFSNGGKTDYPVFTAGSDKICIGEKFYDETGSLREGTKVCNSPLPDCSEDGAKACTANAAYTAAATNGLADKVVSSQTVAGIAGNLTLPDPTKVRVNNGPFGVAGSSLTPTLAECASDGGINCVAVASYPAAKLANFSNGDIRSGVTVAGVAGVLSGAPANCASDGAVGCLSTNTYAAALTTNLATKILVGNTVAGVPGSATAESHANCAADGATGCVAVTDFPAVDKLTKLTTGNIKKDIVIAGVTGDYPSSTHPLTGADSTTDLPIFTSVNGGNTYQWFKSDGARLSGTVEANASVTPGPTSQVLSAGLYRQVTVAGDANLLAGNIKKDTTIFTVTGSVIPTAPPCLIDGGTDCVASATFAAAATANLADKVLSGATVAAIAGNVTLPDASKVLSTTKYGVAGTSLTGTLALPDPSKVWVSNGNFGVAGTGSTPTLADCSADGIAGCVTVDGFKSADMTKAIPSSILSGSTIAGISGSVIASPAACAADGGISCVANESYTAAATSGLAAKVVSGNTVAGTPGSATAESHNDCAADGATNCVAVTNFPAVDKLTKLTTGNIKKDVVIAGVTGDYPSSTHLLVGSDNTTDLPILTAVNGGNTYQWFKADGTRLSGVVEANASVTPGTTSQVLNAGLYRQVTVVGDANLIAGNIKKDSTIFTVTGSVIPTAPPCLIDGGTDCVASSTFAAAATVNLADKVLSGATVAAIAGNVTLPDASKVLSTTPYGVAGTSLTGTLALPDPAKVHVSNGNFGIGGNTSAPTLADCSADGLAGCVTVDGYKSADMTKAISVNILTGTTIAGISGSVIASPAACAADGGTNCVANTAYTAAATTNLANKVLSGNTVAAVAGNVTLPIVGNVYTGIQYGVAGTGNTGTLTLPSAGNVLATNGAFGVGGTGSTPTLTLPTASNVRVSNGAFGSSGSSVTPTLADCSADGGTSCVAVPSYTAAATSGLAPKVLSGTTVAGIPGSATAESHSNCAADGSTGCVATSTYASALTIGLASKVLSTGTVAGIAGNVTLPSAGNVYAGIQYGVAGTGNTGTLTIPSAGNVRSGNGTFGVGGTSVLPTLADCSADGDVGCVAVGPYYAAAVTTGLAPKIVSGNTVAGIVGSATAESHSDCAADGATGCITVSTYKAADMTQVVAGNIKSSVTIAGVVGAYPSVTYPLPSASATTDLASLAATTSAGSYEWWGSDGSRYTGAITDASTITPTTSNQTFNASLYRQFTVAGDANLVAGKIKSGVSIFGVTGDYPSATNPLAGADSTADLDLATFDAKIKSSANFEWFSSDGTRYQNAGDADITAANIANGVTIFGATGTLQGAGTIDAWNVRAGVTIAGVAGALKTNCRNSGNRTYFNYDGAVASIGTAGVTTGTTYEYWDTIDDYYGFPANKVAAWSSDTVCDSSVWQDVTTTNGGSTITTCAASPASCQYKDKITNLVTTKVISTALAWNTALSTCNSSTYGGYAAGTWRLPTQKEFMSMYEHGITSLDSANFMTLANMRNSFWSSSTFSTYTTNAWYVNLAYGSTFTTAKTGTNSVICVR